MKQIELFSCKTPCSNCPYRKDAPTQHWHKIEFEGLINNGKQLIGAVYKCHKNNGSVCVGWLMMQDKNRQPSIALRISLSKNNITRQYLDSLYCKAPMFETEQEMIIANFPELLQNQTT